MRARGSDPIRAAMALIKLKGGRAGKRSHNYAIQSSMETKIARLQCLIDLMGEGVKRSLQPEIAWCRSVTLGLGAFLVVSCIVTKLLWKVLGPAATALIDAPILSWL